MAPSLYWNSTNSWNNPVVSMSSKSIALALGATALFLGSSWSVFSEELPLEGAKEGFADSDGVPIHYVELGSGDPVVMIHGFPDFWYSWRDQMAELSQSYRTIAIDQRGYNKSGQPEGLEAYGMERLTADVVAVLDALNIEKATIIGHDWGGMVAWSVAASYPERVQRLGILNLPHPKGLSRELATNPTQQANSQYARDFQQPNAHEALTAEGLAFWVQEPDAREHYVRAFARSNFKGMLDYYRANYPKEPYEPITEFPQIRCPTLVIHGLDDPYLLSDGLNGTWNWIDAPLTIFTIPGVGHFVHREATAKVNDALARWLAD